MLKSASARIYNLHQFMLVSSTTARSCWYHQTEVTAVPNLNLIKLWKNVEPRQCQGRLLLVSWLQPWMSQIGCGAAPDMSKLCRFLPNFARLGSWNVAMFVTVEQVRTTTQLCFNYAATDTCCFCKFRRLSDTGGQTLECVFWRLPYLLRCCC